MTSDYEVIKVEGEADDFPLVFDYNGEQNWSCSVPKDTKDGYYACWIRATTNRGQTAYWSGYLYIYQGICHFHLMKKCMIFTANCDKTYDFSNHSKNIVCEINKCEHV